MVERSSSGRATGDGRPTGAADSVAGTPTGETYVEVRDEPRHRRRFENDFVRVYDVLIPSGDTTLYHRHTEDTFYVAVNEATVRDRTWGEDEVREGTAPAGSCLCRPHRTRPLIHQVHNLGPADMRLIGAEIKATPAVTALAALDAPGHTLTLERDRLRVYELALDPGQSTGDVDYRFSSLTVMLTVATLHLVPADGPEHTVISRARRRGVAARTAAVGDEQCRRATVPRCRRRVALTGFDRFRHGQGLRVGGVPRPEREPGQRSQGQPRAVADAQVRAAGRWVAHQLLRRGHRGHRRGRSPGWCPRRGVRAGRDRSHRRQALIRFPAGAANGARPQDVPVGRSLAGDRPGR